MGTYTEKITVDSGQFELRDEFGQQIFLEGDEPNGVMISMELNSYENPWCHLSKEGAKRFAEHILALLKEME